MLSLTARNLVQLVPSIHLLAGCLVASSLAIRAQTTEVLPGTQPLTWDGDLSARMVAGIDKFLMNEIERSVGERAKRWQRDFSSREAYEKSIQPNRERFRKCIGAVDLRLPANALEYVSSSA